MKIVLFPGSFKPPHKGHLKVVETIMKKYKPDIFYLIISKKPRIIEAPFEKKLHEFTPQELKYLSNKFKIDKVNKKVIEQAMETGVIPAISAKTTYEFWKTYLQTLPEKTRDKIKVSVAFLPSPVLTAFTIAKSKKLGENDELLLVKAEKDKNNKRFDIFDAIKVKKQEILIPTFRDFNSWQIRKAIYNDNWKKVEEYLPKLDNKEKKKLINLLKAHKNGRNHS